MTKTVYSYDPRGYYAGEINAHKSPLEDDVYLIPGNATEVKPPDFHDGKLRKWAGEIWVEEEKPEIQISVNSSNDELLVMGKREKYFEVETIRKNQQFQPITYQDSEFSASQMARQNLLGIITILNGDQEKKYLWNDNQNTAHQFLLKDFKNILSAILDRDSKLYCAEASIKNKLNQISEPTLMQSVNMSDMWNDCYDQS